MFDLNRTSASVKGVCFIFSAYLLYAVSDAAAKWLVHDISVWQVLFVRSALGCIVCYAIIGHQQFQALTKWPWRRDIVVMNLANLLGWIAYYSAARDMPLTQLYCMYYLSPIITVLLGGIWLREPVNTWHWLAMALGFGGALVVINPSSDLPKLIPFCFGLVTALSWAVAGVLYRRTVHDNDNWSLINSFNWVMVLFCAVPSIQLWQMPLPSHCWALAVVSIAAVAAHYFYLNGMRLISVAVAGPISFSSLLWSLLFGQLVFNEFPAWPVLLGAAMIIAAGAIILATLPKESRVNPALQNSSSSEAR